MPLGTGQGEDTAQGPRARAVPCGARGGAAAATPAAPRGGRVLGLGKRRGRGAAVRLLLSPLSRCSGGRRTGSPAPPAAPGTAAPSGSPPRGAGADSGRPAGKAPRTLLAAGVHARSQRPPETARRRLAPVQPRLSHHPPASGSAARAPPGLHIGRAPGHVSPPPAT